MHDELTIAILAAGASRRLGQPKQLVMIDGKPLLRRQCEVAIEAGIGPVAVILGCNAEACRTVIDDLPLSIYLNDNWADGLGTSIARAAQSALFPPPAPRGRASEGTFRVEQCGLLLLHCDQHAITVADLLTLYSGWDDDRSKIVRSRSGSYVGPPVIFPGSCLADLCKLVGDNGAKSVIAKHGRSKVVDVDVPSAIEDLDTPEQLKKLK